MAFPTIKQRRLKVTLRIKANTVNDGILLYCAESNEGHGEFASLAIKDRRVEFRFDVGNGAVVTRSETDVSPGEWIAISAFRTSNEGRLIVSGSNPVVGHTTRNYKAINLQTLLYIGGVDSRISVNPEVGVQTGFDGCITDVRTCSFLCGFFVIVYVYS